MLPVGIGVYAIDPPDRGKRTKPPLTPDRLISALKL